jgi:hypothetical protein
MALGIKKKDKAGYFEKPKYRKSRKNSAWRKIRAGFFFDVYGYLAEFPGLFIKNLPGRNIDRRFLIDSGILKLYI